MFKPSLCLILTAALGATPAFAEAPSVTHLFPPGAQRGQTTTITLHGNFAWPVGVHSPGATAVVTDEPGKIELTIPSDLNANRIWVRIFNSDGASDALPFLIGNFPEMIETEPNTSLREVEKIESLPVTINGTLKGADVDCYSIPVEAGQTLVAAIEANTSLGSPIDSVLQVTLPNGIVVADNHDSHGLDPRVLYQVQESGRLIVRVFGFSSEPNQSIALQGCERCIYRLSLTTGPYVWTTVPLAVSSSQQNESVEMVGWNIPQNSSATLMGQTDLHQLFEVENPGDLRILAGTTSILSQSSGLAGSLRTRILPIATSVNLRDGSHDQSVNLTLPHAVTGRLNRAGQVDRYSVSLKQGETLVVSVESQTLGLSIDPVVRLINSEGKKLAEVDDAAGTRDAVLTYSATEDGEVTISVMNRYHVDGEFPYYLMTARLEEPDFELSLRSDRVTVPSGGTGEIVVGVVRRQKVGPITLSAIDLPDGVTVEPVVSQVEGETAGQVTLIFTNSGIAHSGPIHIVGRATEPNDIHRTARTPSKLGASLTTLWLTAVGPTN